MNRPLNAGKFRRKAYTKEGERAIIYKLNYAILCDFACLERKEAGT